MLSNKDLMNALIALSIEAGAAVNAIYETDFSVETKDDGSPVTKADEACETIILAGLEKFAPQTPVLAEESASAGNIDEIGQQLGSRFFLVDPLDGTKEFVKKTGEFTVNIALVENGRPVLGVVYAPALARIYAGIVGKGAYASDVVAAKVDLEPITARRRPADGWIAVASRSHRSAETDALLETMPVADFVAAGSSLKFCLVAEGKADVYPRLGRTMEWDTGAGQAVLEAAGGSVLALPEKTPLAYGKAARGFDNPHFICYGAEPVSV